MLDADWLVVCALKMIPALVVIRTVVLISNGAKTELVPWNWDCMGAVNVAGSASWGCYKT